MKGRKNYNFALKFHELWRSIRDAQLKIDEVSTKSLFEIQYFCQACSEGNEC